MGGIAAFSARAEDDGRQPDSVAHRQHDVVDPVADGVRSQGTDSRLERCGRPELLRPVVGSCHAHSTSSSGYAINAGLRPIIDVAALATAQPPGTNPGQGGADD